MQDTSIIKYEAAPIVEALCEFRFASTKQWDLTLPGLFFKEIKEDFPEKEQQATIETQVSKEDGQVQINKINRMLFYRADRQALVQLAPNLLVINYLAPYAGWELFLPAIMENLTIYQKVIQPDSITRVGLRYINRITIPPAGNIRKYLSYYPQQPESLPAIGGSNNTFLSTLEYTFPENSDKLVLKLGTAVPEKIDATTLLLDFDYYVQTSQSGNDSDTIKTWLDQVAHKTIKKTFEDCITDTCRELFGGKI